MSKNIRTQLGKIVGKTLNDYHQRVKPKIDDLKFKEQYQGRIIDCMVGEVDDNYIETPETDSTIIKLEHSKEGLIKVPSIKGKTILVDADGNETDTPAEGCRLVSVGEEEDNKLIILSKNEDNSLSHKTEILLNEPLRSLPNGLSDEIVGNQLITNTLEIKLNGDEDENIIKYVPSSGQECTVFQYNNTKIATSNNLNNIFIDKNIWQGLEEGLIALDDRLLISVKNEKLESLDVIGFKKWLSRNNLKIICKRKEPIIEELPNSITLQGFDDTAMYIENSITPTVTYGYNALIPYKEELRTQKEEVENNTLDIENNIIPYLMDMEFNLMLMEDE